MRKIHIFYNIHVVSNRLRTYPHHTHFILHILIVHTRGFNVILKYFYAKNSIKKRRRLLMLYTHCFSLPINDFISFHVTNYHNATCSSFQYMSMYVYHVNNEDLYIKYSHISFCPIMKFKLVYYNTGRYAC